MTADIDIGEPKPPEDPDSPLAFSMEGEERHPPAALIPRFWEPGWNSVQAVNKFQAEIGGPLRGGAPGCRLIETNAGAAPDYFGNIPAPFARREDERLIVPLHHIFGSEPLSMLAPGIADLAPEPYLALHPDDAARMRVAEGNKAILLIGGRTMELPIRIVASLPPGLAGLPAGLPETAGVSLPAWGRLQRMTAGGGQ
jgi:NADH-quinone oxidoreductase subunit G